jgi:hypothetical protein
MKTLVLQLMIQPTYLIPYFVSKVRSRWGSTAHLEQRICRTRGFLDFAFQLVRFTSFSLQASGNAFHVVPRNLYYPRSLQEFDTTILCAIHKEC